MQYHAIALGTRQAQHARETATHADSIYHSEIDERESSILLTLIFTILMYVYKFGQKSYIYFFFEYKTTHIIMTSQVHTTPDRETEDHTR